MRAVIAESYERIHRSNLLMMGILPLQFLPGENASRSASPAARSSRSPGWRTARRDEVTVRADDKEFRARVRLDTPREREYLRHGGILPYVLRRLLTGDPTPKAWERVAEAILESPGALPRLRAEGDRAGRRSA